MQYTVLKHEKDSDFHVDFLLDCGDERLLTWKICDERFAKYLVWEEKNCDLDKQPISIDDTIYANCRRVFDHRRKYLDFSGDLGNHRGYIIRVECGSWELRELTVRRLVINTVGRRLEDNSPMTRQWCFEPPVAMTLAPDDGTPSDRLIRQLPPPSDENWVVFCHFLW